MKKLSTTHDKVTGDISVQSHAINVSKFDSVGRGVPVNGYVLIAVQNGNAVINESDWREGLKRVCRHGKNGWSCKCFNLIGV